MPRQILINLPVSNLPASTEFFKNLGLQLNEKLTDEHATCFTIEENIVVALLTTDHFKETINGNSIADNKTNETLLAIGVDTKEEVTALLDKAVLAGGSELHDRVELPELYGGTFKDLDGHLWNIFCMAS